MGRRLDCTSTNIRARLLDGERHGFVAGAGDDGGQFQDEAAAFARRASTDPAAVLGEDLLAHRQPQAGAAALLGGDEGAEEVRPSAPAGCPARCR